MDGEDLRERLVRALPYLAAAALIVGFINFFWVFAESTAMGDALHGKIVDGHYFLGNHGTYTEVDQGTFEWSRIHSLSLIVTHPIALAGMFFFVLRRALPARMAGTMDPKLARVRLDLVRNSGPVLGSMSTGGRIGRVRMSGPLIETSVFPNGLIVKPRFMPELAILAAEILEVHPKQGFGGSGVEITHLGTGAATPIVLYRRFDDPVIERIREVAAGAGTNATPLPPDAATIELQAATVAEPPSPPTAGRWSRPIPGMEGIEPPWLANVLAVFGLGVGFFLILTGLLWAVPKLGLFGLVWTLFAVVITGYNAWRFLVRR
jgi:hypothetical protein